MKSLRYLNTILTVIAVLLTLNLWTQWAGSPVNLPTGGGTAHAATDEGLQNPANQRNEMITQLRKQVAATENLTALLKSGNVKVKVDSEVKK